MAGNPSTLDAIRKLPLWAQVLMAARFIERALVDLAGVPKGQAEMVRAACEAAARCAGRGAVSHDDERVLKTGEAGEAVRQLRPLKRACYFLWDSAKAAEASESFGAADAACSSSAAKAFALAGEAPGMNPVRVAALLAAELDQFTFNCNESKVGFYDAIPDALMQRLTPITQKTPAGPPAERVGGDPMGGGR